jgi:hypothetical protein
LGGVVRYRQGNLRRLYERHGTQRLATGLGVSPSTVRRWLRSGRGIPERYWPRAERLEYDPVTGRRLPTLRRLQSRFLRHAPAELAAIFGVTRRTAEGWRKRGRIPPERLRMLEEPAAAPTRKLRTTRKDLAFETRGEDWQGRFTEGASYSVALNRPLDPELVVAIMAWAASLPERRDIPDRRYQLIAKGKVLFGSPDDADTTAAAFSYYKGLAFRVGADNESHGVDNIVISSGAWSDRDTALNDFRERLYHAVDFETKLYSVTYRVYHFIRAKRDRRIQ